MSKIFGKPSSQTATSNQQATSGSVSNSNSVSDATSQSNNQAFQQLQQGLTPQVNNGVGASNSIAALLGVGGDPAAQAAAFQQFRDSTGYNQQLQAGSQAITGNAASKGLLNSGGTARGLQQFGQGLADASYKSYLDPLQNLMQGGTQAAGVISGAGQQSMSNSHSVSDSNSVANSQSTGSSNSSGKGAKKGIGGLLGSGLSLGAKYLTGGIL